ncbi:hypothetical protein PN36_28765 [Candidatus Thiomargarita nelsonii]|uniref:Sulfatase-modifying factor enzyme-like domain-containing protein n=1 Tax=Candidatus Thiomargarita nelsonii TaxID=1003181 RepID=A0A0A6P3E0_9GAMM|nr:hypothetical protein PN36_28765 [Candidatus Thiomargarita nelsonii]
MRKLCFQENLRAFGRQVFRDYLKDGSKGPQMVWIAGGYFQMGDMNVTVTSFQGGGFDNEKPVHSVFITQDFGIGRYEVTFAEYDKFAQATGRKKPDDEGWGRGNRPVINVSWNEAVAYTQWLATQTGKKYRLPTETEWEYAARGGTITNYWWGNTASHEYANYGKEPWGALAKGKDRWEYTAPVGSFEPNQFGIYDTVGNIWEWTQDIYSDYSSSLSSEANSHRVVRGGSWSSGTSTCRAAIRGYNSPGAHASSIGFRLLREP